MYGWRWKACALPEGIVTRTSCSSLESVRPARQSHSCWPQGRTSICASGEVTKWKQCALHISLRLGGRRLLRQAQLLEVLDLLPDRDLGRQAFGRAGAVEAVDALDAVDDELRVLGHRDRSAVAEADHVLAHLLRGIDDGLDAR